MILSEKLDFIQIVCIYWYSFIIVDSLSCQDESLQFTGVWITYFVLNLIAYSYYKQISNYHTYVFLIGTLGLGLYVCPLYAPCMSLYAPVPSLYWRERWKGLIITAQTVPCIPYKQQQQKLIATFEEMEHIIHNFTTITTYLMISYKSIQQLLYM